MVTELLLAVKHVFNKIYCIIKLSNLMNQKILIDIYPI